MDTIKSRREFLQFMTSQSALFGLTPFLATGFAGCVSTSNLRPFDGLTKTTKDDLVLVDGLEYHFICKWGDPINKIGDLFGFDNDFTCFIPLKGQTSEGLLWVNHEATSPEFIHKKDTKQLTRSINEVVKEQETVGGSILHIKRVGKTWKLQKDSPYNRRLHARTKIPFSQESKIQGSRVAVGTLANCAGGLTPWNTVLTSEENYQDFYGDAFLKNGKRHLRTQSKFGWNRHFPLPPEHYGWIVEVNPFTGKSEKQVLLGRAPHEGATVVTTKDNRVAVYMGEDRKFGYIFKFVSTGANLKSGTLYAADTLKGRWLALDIDKSPALKKAFKNQLEVLTYSHQAAEIVGATPQDRPEDIQVHPKTGDVFIALTKNHERNNLYGSLLKISESGDHDAIEFQASTWMSGGLQSGLACPDNLCFDRKGNLWVTTDMSTKEMTDPAYKSFGNNGLYYVPLSGPGAGKPLLVASAPNEAELTGPWFSPDQRTLFLSVQHPGADTRKNLSRPTSQWPDGPGQLPRSSVIAITGPLFHQILA